MTKKKSPTLAVVIATALVMCVAVYFIALALTKLPVPCEDACDMAGPAGDDKLCAACAASGWKPEPPPKDPEPISILIPVLVPTVLPVECPDPPRPPGSIHIENDEEFYALAEALKEAYSTDP